MTEIKRISAIAIMLFCAGCGLAPVTQQMELPNQVFGAASPSEGNSIIIFYNDSNFLMYGLDGSGKINLYFNGKGVGRLDIGNYVIVEAAKGKHQVTLMHRDFFDFSSDHELEVQDDEVFIKIYSKLTSHGLKKTGLPEDFLRWYKPIYK